MDSGEYEPRLRSHQCGKCHKSFREIRHLKTHEVDHYLESPFKCSHCNESFNQSWALTIHRKSHTNSTLRKLSRDVATSIQSDTEIMKIGQRDKSPQETQQSRKPQFLVCTLCDEEFSNPILLRFHIKSHEPLSQSVIPTINNYLQKGLENCAFNGKSNARVTNGRSSARGTNGRASARVTNGITSARGTNGRTSARGTDGRTRSSARIKKGNYGIRGTNDKLVFKKLVTVSSATAACYQVGEGKKISQHDKTKLESKTQSAHRNKSCKYKIPTEQLLERWLSRRKDKSCEIRDLKTCKIMLKPIDTVSSASELPTKLHPERSSSGKKGNCLNIRDLKTCEIILKPIDSVISTSIVQKQSGLLGNRSSRKITSTTFEIDKSKDLISLEPKIIINKTCHVSLDARRKHRYVEANFASEVVSDFFQQFYVL